MGSVVFSLRVLGCVTQFVYSTDSCPCLNSPFQYKLAGRLGKITSLSSSMSLPGVVQPISLLSVLVLCYKRRYFCEPDLTVKNTSTHNLRLLCYLR